MITRRGLLCAGGALLGTVAAGAGVHLALRDDDWEPNHSYWTTRTDGDTYSAPKGDIRLDMAVVGGGFTGLSTAHHVKARFPELRVGVFEARRLGFGASSRNGGLLVGGTAASGEMPGAEGNKEYVHRLVEDHDLDCDLVGRAFDPYRLVLGLGQLCQRQGVQLYERARIRRLEHGRPVRLVGDGFRVEADHVVLGTNAYTPCLGILERELMPVHHGTIVTEPLGSSFEALPVTFSRDIAGGSDYYWGRTLPDRRLLFGGGLRYSYGNGLSFPGAPNLYRALTRAMRGLFPQVGDARVAHAWSGPLAVFTDTQPRLGMVGEHENVRYGVGYAGMGVAMAIRFGSFLARWLDGIAPPDWTRAPATRLPGEPLRYMGVNAGLHLIHMGVVEA